MGSADHFDPADRLPVKSHKEDNKMKITQTVLAGALWLTAALASAPVVHAERGWLNVKNCSNVKLTFKLFDWNDSIQLSPRSKMHLDPGETDRRTCRKSWSQEDAPGCKGIVEYCESGACCCYDHRHDRLYSGDYTIWMVEDLTGDRHHYIRSGIASDCNDNDPTQFTLSGDELDGCAPELLIYGNPDKSGESYVIEDMKIGDMTKLRGDGSLNDWIRALEMQSSAWELCEHVEGAGGYCLHIFGTWDLAFDTFWNGEWDQRFSSIRPLSCY